MLFIYTFHKDLNIMVLINFTLQEIVEIPFYLEVIDSYESLDKNKKIKDWFLWKDRRILMFLKYVKRQ